jgi:hypothetical protein
MGNYRSPRPTVPQMLEELIAGGRTEHAAASQLRQAVARRGARIADLHRESRGGPRARGGARFGPGPAALGLSSTSSRLKPHTETRSLCANAGISRHFERSPIQYALETDWLAEVVGLELRNVGANEGRTDLRESSRILATETIRV